MYKYTQYNGNIN